MHPPDMLRTHRAAFTLIELMIVIVILGVLITLVAFVSRSVMSNADRSKATSNLRNLHVIAQNYSNDHNGRIIPNRYQNPRGPGGPGFTQNWRQMLVDLEYITVPDNLERNAGILGHPGLVKKHSVASGESTFAMNVRIGYRANPSSFQGVGTFLQAEHPSRTLFMTSGVFTPGAAATHNYPEVIWPTGTPEAGTFPEEDEGGMVLLMFLDGHVEARRPDDIPRTEGFETDERLFWRGTSTSIY